MKSTALPPAYDPQLVEDQIYKIWEKSGFFDPDNLKFEALNSKFERNSKIQKSKSKKFGFRNSDFGFSIAMPPPNATGELHMGHAMFLTIQDLMIRYHRMKGERALWLPGTDHASIATQNKVEKILFKKSGQTRHDLGRTKFLKQVDAYVKDSQHIIRRQIRKMGSSCDWSRERYTLDDGLTAAVQEVFVRMYDDGLIYRGHRIVNWCPRCASTLADDEVEYKEAETNFYTFKYSANFPIAISTTRPETKLGDTAVAVNPADRRYKKYLGQTYEVDFIGQPLIVKIIADQAVDPKFGTGALGVTPAHSLVDFDLAEKHGLPLTQIIGEDGKMAAAAGRFAGLSVIDARQQIAAELKKHALLIKEEQITHNISQCYRCDTVIEPLISKQWFINVSSKFKVKSEKLRKTINKSEASLKEMAIAVVKKGAIKIIPKRFDKTYFHWMNYLRDWCVSRQIWFGHRIPVYYKRPSKPIEITYFAHGTTIDNEMNKASGHADVLLSKLGRQQAKELGQLIKKDKFDVVFCSDLKRAVETAKLALGDRGVQIIKDKRLREIDYGKLTQKSAKSVGLRKVKSINEPFSGGESYKDVERRMADFLADLIDKYAGKRVAIVGHQGPQLALDVITNNITWEQAFADDWRNQKAWQPGWNYKLAELTKVSREPIKGWDQDTDTLDTWFSSGLWTFSTLGWPKSVKSEKLKVKSYDQMNDLERFHPTTVMETGYDILFFWVARMILMTTYALGEVPFKTVYLHGLVRDKQGRKMSKSLGNGIDPLEMIKKYGADAVRLSLIIGTTPGNDIRLYEEKIAGYRNFVNKIWNVARFVIAKSGVRSQESGGRQELLLSDKWILSELDVLVKHVNKNLENYQFSLAGEEIYDFLWHKYADWYVEATKIEQQEQQSAILRYVLEKCLIILHPFVPFVTEEIWRKIKNKTSERLLIVEPWVEKIDYKVSRADALKFNKIQEIIISIRNARTENKIPAGEVINCQIETVDSRLIAENKLLIEKMAKSGVRSQESGVGSQKSGISCNLSGCQIYIKKNEKKVSAKDQADLLNYIQSLEARLKNPDFLKNAPADVVQKEKTRLREAQAKLGVGN